jgi:hypothetical protein
VLWTDLQENLDRVPYTQALKLTKHPGKIGINAIKPLDGEGSAAPAKSGEPAALPAGQAAGLDQGLT